jgi:hypothetical protein
VCPRDKCPEARSWRVRLAHDARIANEYAVQLLTGANCPISCFSGRDGGTGPVDVCSDACGGPHLVHAVNPRRGRWPTESPTDQSAGVLETVTIGRWWVVDDRVAMLDDTYSCSRPGWCSTRVTGGCMATTATAASTTCATPRPTTGGGRTSTLGTRRPPTSERTRSSARSRRSTSTACSVRTGESCSRPVSRVPMTARRDSERPNESGSSALLLTCLGGRTT